MVEGQYNALTDAHRDELETVWANYYRVAVSNAGRVDPSVFEEVATGKKLEMMKTFRNAVGEGIYPTSVLRVYEYSPTCSHVLATVTIKEPWDTIRWKYDVVFLREDGVWKVADGGIVVDYHSDSDLLSGLSFETPNVECPNQTE